MLISRYIYRLIGLFLLLALNMLLAGCAGNGAATQDSYSSKFAADKTLEVNTAWSDSFEFSQDGRFLLVGDNSKAVLWDLDHTNDNNLERQLNGIAPITSVALSPDGKIAVVADNANNILLWDLTQTNHFTKIRAFNEKVSIMAFSPDGRWLAVVSSSGGSDCVCKDGNQFALWDLSKGNPTLDNIDRLDNNKSDIKAAAFSKDSAFLATADLSGEISLRDMQHPDEKPFAIQGPVEGVSSLAFSEDGTLAAGSRHGTISIWDGLIRGMAENAPDAFPDTLLETPEVIQLDTVVTSVTFNADGTMLAAACGDATVRVWHRDQADKYIDTQDPALLTLRKHSGEVASVKFSPDGKMLAALNLNGVSIWEIQ